MQVRQSSVVAALGAAGVVVVLGAAPAWASGAVTVTPQPVLVSPTAPTTTTLALTVAAATPLPAAIDRVTIEMTPVTGGVTFTQVTAGCTIGPSTAVSCPWHPAAAGEQLTVTATVLVAPGVPAQTVPVHWAVASSASQQPVDEGDAALSLVTSLPSPSPTLTATPSPTPSPTTTPDVGATEAPVPTAVPAGEGPSDPSPSRDIGFIAMLVLAAVGMLAAARSWSRRDARR